ncbi:hypothetical protein ONS95_007318 [Cadophora gregata]|uniref:uncharacterized protein n=1 Tax=Cadophora gregata TaxID=51156 RepID=UPI0026DD4A9F|nr:uncharacterized protein ONS95_007318 [Cadophora gregata]KAK0100872.1 hypothetical protein ONS95_007318 [Cadophora gregata]KAK0117136.1 hypothetical protein ONS96_012970 [Cadophora gregata f. sp. sojae]
MASSHSTPNTSSNSSPSPYQHPQHPQNPTNQPGMNHSSTSSSSSRPRAGTPRSMKAGKGTGSRNEPPPFTASMQDAQARNKDPYESSEDSSDDGGRWDAYGNDSYENVQKRRMAAVILDSPELLMMHAQARSDSIAATRYYFTKMLCGFHDENDTYPVDGQVADKEKEKRERDREREKARRQVSGQSSRR